MNLYMNHECILLFVQDIHEPGQRLLPVQELKEFFDPVALDSMLEERLRAKQLEELVSFSLARQWMYSFLHSIYIQKNVPN